MLCVSLDSLDYSPVDLLDLSPVRVSLIYVGQFVLYSR